MSKNNKKFEERERGESRFDLHEETKQWIFGILMIVLAVLIGLSFFGKAGKAGEGFMFGSNFLIGQTVFLIPLIFILGGSVFINARHSLNLRDGKKKVFWPLFLAIMILVFGLTGIFTTLDPQKEKGGLIGTLLNWPLIRYFGFWATLVIFVAPILISALIFWQFLKRPRRKEREVEFDEEEIEKPSIIRKIFAPQFKVKEVGGFNSQEIKPIEKPAMVAKAEAKATASVKAFSLYQPPPLDFLEIDRGAPTSGDTKVNAAIIKKTLQNFNIDVAMSDVSVGPTVTQYSLKPAEGIKLSKITGLSNDLALALAAHPIRIEAPIPGKSLVGIEIPNKVRAQVRLRNLIEEPGFQKAPGNLMIAMGRDVSGASFFTDLTRMPHMLVAGSTGSGKTIFLNTLILSLLYQPTTGVKSAGPDFLRLILVDPKRVEFPVYENLPHLLCPVIYNANQTVNALKWLTGEMERRFDVLAAAKARDIRSFNELAAKNKTEPLPFIVVVIDELADLMAARGREIEAGIVRLAQMARAVGIHLVVATQRPSVEVITGLIKANITSRVTFQVASQVDSRTILDTAGAEKLLGAGDMLYLSSEVTKPKRIQAPYASDTELKKIIAYINDKKEEFSPDSQMDEDLVQELDRGLEDSEGVSFTNGGGSNNYEDDDPLFDEAKKTVIEARKASASLLQRRLRIGYARAARLIDILEDKGFVGPGEGAKPREVFGEAPAPRIPVPPTPDQEEEEESNVVATKVGKGELEETEDGWEKI